MNPHRISAHIALDLGTTTLAGQLLSPSGEVLARAQLCQSPAGNGRGYPAAAAAGPRRRGATVAGSARCRLAGPGCRAACLGWRALGRHRCGRCRGQPGHVLPAVQPAGRPAALPAAQAAGPGAWTNPRQRNRSRLAGAAATLAAGLGFRRRRPGRLPAWLGGC